MSWQSQLSTSFQVIATLSCGILYFLMLTVEQCRKILGTTELTDQEIEEIRNGLYLLCEETTDQYFPSLS